MILEARDICHAFGALQALDGVSLAVRQGEMLGLIGPNGAGKTTLFNILTGMLRPTTGDVVLDGRVITGLAPHTIARMGIARTFQIGRPFGAMTAFENVLIGAYLHERDERVAEEAAGANLELVGLADRRHELAERLPLMDRKRMELARAIATRPRLLLIDEFMAGLNPREVEDANRLLLGLSDRGMTILFIEHVMDAVMAICDRLVVLNFGAKIAEGTPEEVVANEEVVRAYLGKWASRA